MMELIKITEQISIKSNDDLVNLTDLWKGMGSPKNKDPKFWLRSEVAIQVTETLTVMLKVSLSHLLKMKRGKDGGTWAHKQIALAYAKYLDPKLHIAVNQVFFERIEEEKNPDLIIDRAVTTYKKKGKSDEWIDRRIKGKLKRKEFTHTLGSHGVSGEGFRNCTNEIYRPLFGGSSAVVRRNKNLPKKANIRDSLSEFELDAVNFSESTAAQMIEKQNLQGNAECEIAAGIASKFIAEALVKAQKIDIKTLKTS